MRHLHSFPTRRSSDLLCGGEALPRDLADALRGRVKELWNAYGPTETAIYSTAGEVGEGPGPVLRGARSEEHTSELQSHVNLVCRILLEKKKRLHFRFC